MASPEHAQDEGDSRQDAVRAEAGPRVPVTWSAAMALGVLLVYLSQVPPVSGDQDTAEFALVLATNGVAHPTGYPLFTLLGHPFVVAVHALGTTWPFAANAWSALGGTVAMFFLHRLAIALIPADAPLGRLGRFLWGLLPVGLFAFNPIWTYETTLAEVYSWHLAWVLGAALAFTGIMRRVAGSGGSSSFLLLAAFWGVICGVGGAHHATAFFVAAPLSLVLFATLLSRPGVGFGRTLGLALVVIVAALPPLASYLIILWRGTHPAEVQWPALAPGWPGLLAHVTGEQYWGYLGRFEPSAGQLAFLRRYVWPFLVLGLAALTTSIVFARPGVQRTARAGLLLAASLGTTYALLYGVGDPSSYFLYPMALGLAALAPVGVALCHRPNTARGLLLASATVLGLGTVALWVPWLRTARERAATYVKLDQALHAMWAVIPSGSTIVFWSEDMCQRLVEYQRFSHERPDVEVVNAASLIYPGRRQAFIARHGFDPIEGLEKALPAESGPGGRDARWAAATGFIEHRVNALSPLPVIHFDPSVPTVDLLDKPGTDSLAAPRPARR